MNCLYITLFFNIFAGIVQTFIKPWNQLLYPRVIEFCRQPFEPRHDFFLHLIIVVELFPQRDVSFFFTFCLIHNVTVNNNNLFVNFRWTFIFCVEKSYDGTHLAFGGTLDRCCYFKHVLLKQTRVYHTNEHGSQVKDQVWRQCCHNKHKKFSYRPTCDVSLLSGHVL